MDNNVYNTPQSSLVTPSTGELELASRWNRLFAAIIDTIIMMCVTLPLMFFTGGFDGMSTGQQPGILYTLGMSLVSWIVFALINGKFLLASGQTIGKKAMEIRIVDLEGNVPVLNTLLARYAVYFLPGLIPVAGGIFSLVNILFIFGAEKRCLHDQVAKTKVVKAN
jgi:uncharacterized RDD family membrane protein YckC